LISEDTCFKHKGLKAYWETGSTGKLPADMVKRIRLLLVHLDSARSLNDIAEGYGKSRNFHPLTGLDCMYALDVTGNYRLVFKCEQASTGFVTELDLVDYH